MALVIPQAPNILGTAITYATPTTSETFVPGTNIYYHVKTGGTAITTTVVVPGTEYGQARPDVAISIGTSSERIIGPLIADLADPTTGLVTVTHSAVTAVTAAALVLGGADMGDYNGEWVTMRHAETEGVARFPSTPQVVKAYEALGWAVVDDPEEDAEPQQVKPKSRAAAKEKE